MSTVGRPITYTSNGIAPSPKKTCLQAVKLCCNSLLKHENSKCVRYSNFLIHHKCKFQQRIQLPSDICLLSRRQFSMHARLLFAISHFLPLSLSSPSIAPTTLSFSAAAHTKFIYVCRAWQASSTERPFVFGNKAIASP